MFNVTVRDILALNIDIVFLFLLVVSLRFVLRKSPKKYSFVLWMVILIRLIVPIQLNYTMATETNQVTKSFYEVDSIIEVPMSFYEDELNIRTSKGMQETTVEWINYVSLIYLVGLIFLLIKNAMAYIKLKDRLKYATSQNGKVYYSDRIDTGLVVGFFRPKIYLPIGLNSKQYQHILSHEKAHIKRLDHIIKPVYFAITLLFWYNPLIWMSYYLMTKDMEMACDETATHSDCDQKEYSITLIDMNKRQNNLVLLPSFSRSKTTQRVINLFKEKKSQKFRIILTSGFILIFAIFVAVDVVLSDDAVGRNTSNEEGTALGEKIDLNNGTNLEDVYVVFPTEGYITATYRMYSPFGVDTFHYGVDIANEVGTKIKAYDDGIVTFSGWSDSLGYHMTIDHGDGFTTLYAHCENLYYNEGDKVQKSNVIASMGKSGKVTGSHLHFSISYKGEKVDPEPFLDLTP